MRLDLLIPAACISFGTSYYAVYEVLSIRSSTTRWMLCAGVTLALFVLSLFIITGVIRPFYACFLVMFLWLIAQRILTVKQPMKANDGGGNGNDSF
jgi:hypothetical protein